MCFSEPHISSRRGSPSRQHVGTTKLKKGNCLEVLIKKSTCSHCTRVTHWNAL